MADFDGANFGVYGKGNLRSQTAYGLEPSQCALVAAHLNDLEAAKNCGFHTVYVEREHEEAWSSEKVAQTKAAGWVDIWIDQDIGGFIEVARRFGIKS